MSVCERLARKFFNEELKSLAINLKSEHCNSIIEKFEKKRNALFDFVNTVVENVFKDNEKILNEAKEHMRERVFDYMFDDRMYAINRFSKCVIRDMIRKEEKYL